MNTKDEKSNHRNIKLFVIVGIIALIVSFYMLWSHTKALQKRNSNREHANASISSGEAINNELLIVFYSTTEENEELEILHDSSYSGDTEVEPEPMTMEKLEQDTREESRFSEPLIELFPGGGEIEIIGTAVVKFTPEMAGVWEFFTFENGDIDPVLWIVDDQGVEIAYCDDFGGNPNSFLSITLQADTAYYVYAQTHGKTGAYMLRVTHGTGSSGGLAADEELPNDGILHVDSRRYFEIAPNCSGIWAFTTKAESGVDPVLYLYDSSGCVVAADDDSAGGMDARVFVLLSVNEIYILETAFYAGSTGSYSVSVASPLEMPGFGGDITVRGEGSVTFTPHESGTWEFRTQSSGYNDPQISVYDGLFTAIAHDDDGAGGFDALIDIDLLAGISYHIYVGFKYNDGITLLSVLKQ